MRRPTAALMMIVVAPVALGALVASPACARSARRPASGALMMAGGDDGSGGGSLDISQGDMDGLRARITRLQQQGGELATTSSKLFEIAMEKPPSYLLREFYATATPEINQVSGDARGGWAAARRLTCPPFGFAGDARRGGRAPRLAATARV